MNKPQSKIGKLQHKFDNSGIGENPVISDEELEELVKNLRELELYMRDRNDKSMAFVFSMEIASVNQMISAREND